MIHIPYWWHATLFEIFWLAGGLASTALTSTNLRDAYKDTEVLEKIRFDPSIHRRHYEMIAVSAYGRLTAQVFRLAISLLIVFAGTVGVLTSNPLVGRITLTGLVVTLALVGISIMTPLASMIDHVQRKRLYELAMGRSAVLAAQQLARSEIDQKEQP